VALLDDSNDGRVAPAVVRRTFPTEPASPKDAGFFPAPQTLVDEIQEFDHLGRDSWLCSYALGGPGRFTTGIFMSGWVTFLRLPK